MDNFLKSHERAVIHVYFTEMLKDPEKACIFAEADNA
jgi:hypothetical protein